MLPGVDGEQRDRALAMVALVVVHLLHDDAARDRLPGGQRPARSLDGGGGIAAEKLVTESDGGGGGGGGGGGRGIEDGAVRALAGPVGGGGGGSPGVIVDVVGVDQITVMMNVHPLS